MIIHNIIVYHKMRFIMDRIGNLLYDVIHKSSPYAGLCFRGGKVVEEESRGAKSETLLSTLLYHNHLIM